MQLHITKGILMCLFILSLLMSCHFPQNVRTLARKKFMVRALMNKVREQTNKCEIKWDGKSRPLFLRTRIQGVAMVTRGAGVRKWWNFRSRISQICVLLHFLTSVPLPGGSLCSKCCRQFSGNSCVDFEENDWHIAMLYFD